MALRAKRYFEDYDVTTTIRNGKTVREYVYKGDWYVRELPAAARRRERVLYPLFSLLAGILLLAAMRQPSAANTGGIFAALSLLALIPAFCVLEGSVEAFFRKGNLTKEDYRERLVMLRVMPAAGAALGLLLTAGYGCDGLTQGSAASGLAAACSLACAAVYGGMAAWEIRTPYRVVKGERSTGADPMAGGGNAPAAGGE